MTRWVCLVVTFVVLGMGAGSSLRADDPEDEDQAWQICGNLQRITRVTQVFNSGQPQKQLTLYVETSFQSACIFFSLMAEGTVEGVSGSYVQSPWHNGNSNASRLLNLPNWGTYNGFGRHWSSYLDVFPARDAGQTQASVTLDQPEEEPPPDEDCSATNSCEEWPGGTPIVLDMAGDGFVFTGSTERVAFDIDADGHPNWTNWTAAGTDDAFLAMDRNGNGRIDDASELFGNHTPVYFSGASGTAQNGFDVLAFFESPANAPFRGDNVITAADSGFARLLLWTDSNHNGASESYELRPAAAAGLRLIQTQYRESKRRDEHGNLLRLTSKSDFEINGERVQVKLVDVWFQFSR